MILRIQHLVCLRPERDVAMSRRTYPTDSPTRRWGDNARHLVWLGTFVVGALIASAALPRRYSAEVFVIGSAAGTIADGFISVFRGWRRGSSDELSREPWPTAFVRLVVGFVLLAAIAFLLYEIS